MLRSSQIDQVEEEVNQEVPYENSIVQRFSKLTTRPSTLGTIDETFCMRSPGASSYSLAASDHTGHTSQTSLASSLSSSSSLSPQQQQQLDHNWQASKASVRERNAVMFNNDLMSDVHFLVGHSGQLRIPAHKYVLATGSSVFYAMFYGGLADTSKDITIPDVEPAAFLNLLK